MKIALLTDGIYPYVIGGMQKHSYYLAKYFAANKIHVHLYHFNQSKLEISKLECFTKEEKEFIHSTVIDFPVLDKMPGHYIRESYRYSELIFERIKHDLSSYDFIYTKGFSGWKLIKEKKKGLACPPIGVNFHGYEMFQKAPDLKVKIQHFFLRSPVKWISRNADIVFSYGGKITEIISHQLNIPIAQIIEIPAGIEKSFLREDAPEQFNPTRFVFLGRYERRKGIEELTAVLKDLISKKEFLFEFIGPIPDDKKIISPKVIYHGEIRDSIKIKQILRNSDVLVCPSYSEGMPNVILEGMASGLAIIATDVGAVNRQVAEVNGFLIHRTNSDLLNSALIEAIDLPRKKMLDKKNASIRLVKERFLWDNIIIETIEKIGGIMLNYKK